MADRPASLRAEAPRSRSFYLAQLTAWMEPFRDLGMTTVSNQSVGSTDHVALDDVAIDSQART